MRSGKEDEEEEEKEEGGEEEGYGACGGAALSAFLKRTSLQARRRSPTSLLLFYKAFPAHPTGNGQELRLPATIAIMGNVSSMQLLSHEHLIT